MHLRLAVQRFPQLPFRLQGSGLSGDASGAGEEGDGKGEFHGSNSGAGIGAFLQRTRQGGAAVNCDPVRAKQGGQGVGTPDRRGLSR